MQENMKMKRNFLIFLILVIVGLSITKIAVTNKITTNGVALQSIQAQIANLDTQNYIIMQQYLAEASLTSLDAKAVKEGFKPNSTDYFVTINQSIASNQ